MIISNLETRPYEIERQRFPVWQALPVLIACHAVLQLFPAFNGNVHEFLFKARKTFFGRNNCESYVKIHKLHKDERVTQNRK